MPSVRIQPALGGMNSEASPEYVGPTQAAVLENLLPRPGKVVLRGPISTGIDRGTSAFEYIEGAAVDSTGSILLRSNGAYWYFDGTTGAVSVAAGITVSPGRRFCKLGNFNYTIPKPGVVAGPVQWDGAENTLNLSNGPSKAVDIAVHLARLFTISRDNALCWSDQGGALSNLASYWQDDVSGLTNQLIVGDKSDRARGLGHVGRSLAIFKDRSLWVLGGLTPSSFTVQRMSSEWGCLSTETIVELSDGCFFLSERGFAYFDGSSVVDVSTDIKGELLTAIRSTGLPYDADTTGPSARYLGGLDPVTSMPFARAASIGRDCVMLTIGVESTDDTVQPTINFCGVYDSQQRTWTRFSSAAFATTAPVYFLATSPASVHAGATLGYDGVGTLFYLDDLANPESADASFCAEDTVDGTTAAIPATSYSKILPLASPLRAAQIKRLLFDYSFVVVSDSDSSIDAWSVSLVDGLGNILLAATPAQASVLQSGYTDDERREALVRKRFQVECYAEASEVQLRVTLPALDSDVTEVIAAEIHDATIEFEAGRDRPTS